VSSVGVILLLDGPLQSWGTQSRFGRRDTDFEPSKSGVIGLVGAALGMPRDDTHLLGQLASLEMAVRVDREGRVLRDYHTVGGGSYRGQPHSVFGTKDTIVTTRYYLMDACFVVALSGEDAAFVERIADALKNPCWPLFFGRRSCVPSRAVYLRGPVEGRAPDLIRRIAWQGPGDKHVPRETRLRCVFEGENGKPRGDVPRNFARHARAFETRFIREEWLNVSDLPGETDVSDQAPTQSALS